LNAVINKPVESEGFSANYSGAGFSHMRFKYHGMDVADFDRWVAEAKSNGATLDRTTYMELEKPSERDPVRYYASVDSTLYNAILNRCVAAGTACMDKVMHADMHRNVKKDHE
jgi:cytochrome o ubiquinol oxidase subunit 2